MIRKVIEIFWFHTLPSKYHICQGIALLIKVENTNFMEVTVLSSVIIDLQAITNAFNILLIHI